VFGTLYVTPRSAPSSTVKRSPSVVPVTRTESESARGSRRTEIVCVCETRVLFRSPLRVRRRRRVESDDLFTRPRDGCILLQLLRQLLQLFDRSRIDLQKVKDTLRTSSAAADAAA